MDITLNPEANSLKAWGILAHVTVQERSRLLALPAGQFKAQLENLEREIKRLKSAPKKKSGWVEIKDKPKFHRKATDYDDAEE